MNKTPAGETTHPSQPGEQQKELRAGINRAALSVMRRNPNWQNPTHKELHLLAVPFEDWPGSAQSDCVMLADFAEQQVLAAHAQSQARIAELERLLEKAYDRFTDADFVPANHELKQWQKDTLAALGWESVILSESPDGKIVGHRLLSSTANPESK
jgi:hypothetical protein